ncbi:MAG: GerMN domain-containing protein [Clostridia bacterium]|nr:GerMN domain-containing protein [Clostridia bacterium]
MGFNKKVIIIICSIILVLGALIYVFFNFVEFGVEGEKVEIQPEQEISDEQLRETTLQLFFKDKLENKLERESRKIDVKDLMGDTYVTIIKELIEGPESSILERIIPEDTKVNSANLQGDMLILDLSEEFLKADIDTEKQKLIIYSIVNTLTELVEVNSVKFLINGEENRSFENSSINFSEPFVRVD